MIILIGSIKGGTGKSTIAFNLAMKMIQENKDVLLVDADPQFTISKVIARKEDLNINNIQKTGKITSSILNLSKRYDNIIIDSGGRDSYELRSGLACADIFICPIKPSILDLDTLIDLSEMIDNSLIFNNKLKSFLVFNQCPTNQKMKDLEESINLVEDLELFNILDSYLSYRADFWRTIGNGISVLELENSKAKNEFNNFYNEIMQGI